MIKQALALLAITTSIGCGSEEEGKKIKVKTALRSTGTSGLSLIGNGTGLINTADAFLANSVVTVDSFKLPIGRINLTAGDNGSGYTEASPNFYACKSIVNSECLVDVVNTSIKDLLAQAAAERAAEAAAEAAAGEVKSSEPVEMEAPPETKTYTGTSIEICADGRDPSEKTFKAKLKASGMIGTTTYYTNAKTGVSTSGPAEETEITMDCMGRNSDLITPIEMSPDADLELTFWAEPAGTILITNNGPLVNAKCTSSTPGEVAFCATLPPFFGTTVPGDAKAEKFQLDVTTTPSTNTSGIYADMLATAVFNAEGDAIGGTLKQIYTNTAGEEKLMHGSMFEFGSLTATADAISFKYGYPTQTDLIKDMPRKTAGTGLTMSDLVSEKVSFNSTPLQ
jgi:hypothetical protein